LTPEEASLVTGAGFGRWVVPTALVTTLTLTGASILQGNCLTHPQRTTVGQEVCSVVKKFALKG